jgi:hypothetical protein
MNRFIRRHLDLISIDELLKNRGEVFCLYAQCGEVKLGYNALGSFRVIDGQNVFDFIGAEQALQEYETLVLKKEKL